ncbi:hypothetical protein [Faecalibaculum rodentium]|uniref:hypothetical protein n=1 Tax=Faecalibaculum rodentium TaxID=1702221 RepID=UPI0023F02A11|nr:hypothetical protein [Faecalibaculum rodentium]
MTLKEFFEQNGNKNIEIQEDGTIRVLEEKGPWKPEIGDRYFHIYGNGDFEEDYWSGRASDDHRAEIGNVFRTNEEIKRMVHRLKARKKFLDAGGHAGPESHKAFRERTDGPIWCAYPCISGKLEADEADYLSAFEIWFESEDDARKAIDSLTDDEKAALCWTGEEE